MLENNDSQELISKAALFEGDFSIDWLLNLSKLKASKILSILDENTKSGLLVEKSSGLFSFIEKEKRESFLTYFSTIQKEELHRRAVKIISEETENEEEKVLLLSRHLLYISNDLDGCRQLIKAGDLYAVEVKYKEAIECYSKAIKDLDQNSEEDADRLYIETVNKYLNMFSVRIESKWTTSILKNAISKTENGNYNTFQALFNMQMAVNQWQQSNYAGAKQYYEKGWQIAQKLDGSHLKRSIFTISAFFNYLQGRFLDTVKDYEKSVQNVEKLPEDTSLLFAIAAIGRAYAAIGQASQGLGMLEAVRKHCLKIKQNQVAQWAIMQIGYILKGIGRIDDAHKLLANIKHDTVQTHDIRTQEDLFLLQALIYYWKDKQDTSVAHLQNYLQMIKENEALGMPTSSYGFILKLCWAMELEKYPKIDDISLEKAVHHSISGENTFYKGYGYRYKALLQKQKFAPPKEILNTLKLSLKHLKKSGHRLAISRTRIEISRLYLSIGEEELARNQAKKAAKIILSHRELEFPDDLKFLIKDLSIKDNLLQEILKLGQEIVTIRNTKDIEKHIILTVIQITGAERGAIFLTNRGSESNKCTLRAAKNITAEDIKRSDFSISMNIIKEVSTTGKGIIKQIGSGKINGTATTNISSCICLPMIIKNEILGVLYFDNRFLSSAFKKTDLDMFTYFAAQAAIAMDNAEAYDEVQRLNHKLNNEKQYYKEKHLESLRFGEIIGQSNAIKNVMKKIQQVADTDTTVLILGETGVGKELVARTILDKSSRSDKPFIRVNCSAFSESLIASELFGHEKGAFTGANEQKAGRFELADGGTLFLDEIGDIPMSVQIQLLRVLQTQEFDRVGGTQTLRSDFRLIAATNHNLQKLVKEGKFREDLFYRLNVFPITAPPLSKRKEDIILLAKHFLRVFGQKMGKPFTEISEKGTKKLLNYEWPGNVRELENVIERGVIMSIPPDFKVPELSIDQHTGLEEKTPTLAENEKQHILWALEKTDWKISGPGGAAELLDINYGTLRSRIKKHGIKKETKPVS